MPWIGYYIEDGVIWYGECSSPGHRDRNRTIVARVENEEAAKYMIARLNEFAHLATRAELEHKQGGGA